MVKHEGWGLKFKRNRKADGGERSPSSNESREAANRRVDIGYAG